VFIVDIGISPFIDCFKGRNLAQACVEAGVVDFLKEILKHKYKLTARKDLEKFYNSLASSDQVGNNIFHDVFMH
jgi:hypothetical protein